MLRYALLSLLSFITFNASVLAQERNAEGLPVQPTTASAEFPRTPSTATVTHRIIDAPSGTFGYEILADGKLLVRQTNVPGQPGNTGCATKADAERLATLVADKVKRGEMPPTVTKVELEGLHLIQ